MEVYVYSISVPAISTIGYGYGLNCKTGDQIYFSGDHRSMRDLGDLLGLAENPPVALIEPYQVLCRISVEDAKLGERTTK